MSVQLSLFQADPLPEFNQHKGLSPRNTWLKAGFDRVVENPSFFNHKDKYIMNGFSEPMAISIAYWCRAFKLAVSNQSKELFPTEFGTLLLREEQGLDPYLEHPSSWWLLHWKLLQPPCIAPSWWWFFNCIGLPNFVKSRVFSNLIEFANRHKKVANTSLEYDWNTILKMYDSRDFESLSMEGQTDKPFAELGILKSNRAYGQEKEFRFNHNNSYLPKELIAIAAIDYCIQHNTLKIETSELAYQKTCPGRVFKITQQFLENAIVDVNHPDIKVDWNEENRVELEIKDRPEVIIQEILQWMYKNKNSNQGIE